MTFKAFSYVNIKADHIFKIHIHVIRKLVIVLVENRIWLEKKAISIRVKNRLNLCTITHARTDTLATGSFFI